MAAPIALKIKKLAGSQPSGKSVLKKGALVELYRFFAFEVFGKVQGVCFRKYTAERCLQLRIKGFCQNTDRNSVVGEAHGDSVAMEILYVYNFTL